MNKSYANCSECELNNFQQHICLTNCKKNLEKVDVLYVTDDPTIQDELESIVSVSKEPYLITSSILCEYPDTITDIPIIANNCKINPQRFYELTKPKVVVCIGPRSQSLFPDCSYYESLVDFSETMVEKKIEDDIILDLSAFESDMHKDTAEKVVERIDDDSDLYMYKIPDKFYTSEYRLVDIQYISGREQVIYIFRDSENKKIYYEPPRKSSNYYWYESVSTKIIDNIENLQLVIGNYQQRNINTRCYSSFYHISIFESWHVYD